MVLDYSISGKIAFTLFEYLEDIIVEALENLKKGGFNKYLANNKLFKTDENSKPLEPKRADMFHCIVVRLLHASKRGTLTRRTQCIRTVKVIQEWRAL